MKRGLSLLALAIVLFACTPQSTPAPIEPTSTSVPTAIPTTTLTVTPSPIPPTATATALPGVVVLPLETLGQDIPWLPWDDSARLAAHVIHVNVLRPPFNSVLVRQAFAAAIDRQAIAAMAEKYGERGVTPATTLTPPRILGRDLYGDVGISFNPEKAKSWLGEAGYTDPSAFPASTIIVNSYGERAPGARYNMAKEMARMWKENLGVTVQVEALKPAAFNDRLQNNPPELMWIGWAADVNDPDNFMRVFQSGSEFNRGKFSSPEYDALVDRAGYLKDPATRQELYIQAERLLTEIEAAAIPLYHFTRQ